jgi:hypothetical protein
VRLLANESLQLVENSGIKLINIEEPEGYCQELAITQNFKPAVSLKFPGKEHVGVIQTK